MRQSSVTHVIAGGHKYEHKIPHREHRLANHLSKKSPTESVLWLYPGSTSDWKISKIDSCIREIAVPTQYSFIRIPDRLIDRIGFRKKFKEIIKSKIKNSLTEYVILWYYSPQFSCLCTCRDLWDTIVYDCSDNHTTAGWNVKKNLGRIKYYRNKFGAYFAHQSEVEILKNTDIVFASSEYLYRKLEPHTAAPIYLEETGVDIEKFNTGEKYDQIEEIKAPRLGFVGKIKQKIDYSLLYGVAQQNPSWNIVLVGPKKEADIEFLLKLSNVSWIGAVDPEDVPKVMNSLDVGLMPYLEIEYNKAVFPLKLYEYLASGLPVVGCGLPSTRRYTQNGIYLHTSNDVIDFSKACSSVLSWGPNQERKKKAAQADWDSKLDRIYSQVLTVHN